MIDDILKRYAPGLAHILRRSVRELVLVTTLGISGAIGCGDRQTVAYGPPPVSDAGVDGARDGGSHSDGPLARDAWPDGRSDAQQDGGPPVMYGPVAYGPPPAQDAGQDDSGPAPAYGPIAYGPAPFDPAEPAPSDWYGR